MFNLNDYFSNPANKSGFLFRPIVCKNGLKFSCQANTGAYCSPRVDKGPWASVEIGFPNRKIDEIMQYAENSSEPTETVYGWVPVEVVEQIVENNGGLADDGGEAFALKNKCETIHNFIQELRNGTTYSKEEYDAILDDVEGIREYFFAKLK